ncbi:hypothetical protein OG887_25525 [Streptomyces sp. NBC_00053]|uniref:hypothetical protein n=1 Tax=unclassified Streptomyces TaxID=2593676 RepID=UPI00224E5995|nr:MULTISPECIES: hypothetical protein [unclassified Streptomyces]MCX5502701.1 hypothetical protein [Streptomyces sp. NBC_00052]MCX5548763.1 hypothetical protein [Streptomyces sp. NBC_00051]
MTTTQVLTVRQNGTAATALLVGPALMAGYGVVRLVGRAVSDYGPGVWWTTAHLLFLAGVLAFVPVFLGLRVLAGERGGGRAAAEVAAWTGLLGAAAVVVQAVIDLTAGFAAADKQAMSEMFDRVQGVPGVMPLVYTVVPMLFWLGLLALVILLAFLRRDAVRWWTPVLVLAGTVLMAVNLDLLPVGALCLGVALMPVRRGLSA